MKVVQVVVSDRMIIVDSEACLGDYTFPPYLWAIQWDGSQGHAEWTNGPNTDLTSAEVDEYIAKFDAAKIVAAEAGVARAAADVARVKTHTEARFLEYPFVFDQLDMIYWDGINGTTIWADTIAAIKAAHPK